MQSPFNDKLAYSYPCKTSQTCIDFEDYDPCESNEDITEKDLVVLLKEEAAKLEREKKKAQASEAESDKIAKPSSDVDDKQKHLPQTNDADFFQEESGARKKTCKYTKNPFFTNRLKLSTSHLPLPPPGPPPQNFPLSKDNDSSTKICPRKKKKCKKHDKKPTCATSDDNGDVKTEENEEEDGEPCEDNKDKDTDNKIKDSGKKRCKKPTNERFPPCKKKESEVSIIFQPRKIPFQLKDLPETSPKDIPEVERQIACGKSEEDCKKKCKKKDKVK